MSEKKEKTIEELKEEVKEEMREKPQSSDLRYFMSKIKQISINIYKKTTKVLGQILNKIIPSYAPRIEIDKKLIPDEIEIDHVEIKHFNEFQILFGLIFTVVFSYLALAYYWILIFVVILGLVMLKTGFEIEEIYVTSNRLLIRRIGLLERIIKIPVDEEHIIEHIVTFKLGRAPVQIIIFSLGLLTGFVAIVSQLDPLINTVIVITAIALILIGMRLGKRIITLYFAGQHVVILGSRKGVPLHIYESLQKAIYKI
jgi:hypothetical protein